MYLKTILLTALGFILNISSWGQNCVIQSTTTKICKDSIATLSVSNPKIDTIPQILKRFEASGLVSWNYRFNPVITGRAHTYGLPGMLVFGDSTSQLGFIEAQIKAIEIGPEASAGVAMAVKRNSFNDGHPFNGPGSYYLALRDGGELILYNGTGNTPSGYFPAAVVKVKIPDINFRNNNKIRLEILPGGMIQGAVNGKVHINYQIPNGILPSGRFALIVANSSIECKGLIASKRNGGILWSNGETTSSITVSPLQTTTYRVSVMEDNKSCTNEIKIDVNKSFVSLIDSIIEGDSFNFNGQILKAPGTYTSILQNSVGCDSIITLNLKVNPRLAPLECSIKSTKDTICIGDLTTLSISTPALSDSITIKSFIETNPGLVHILNFSGKSYFAYTKKLTWLEAKLFGDSLGLDLLIINDSIEENLVFKNLPIKIGQYWIGLFQDRNDSKFSEPLGGWKWVDSTYLTYQNWEVGEPNNNLNLGIQDCGTINYRGIKWDDDDCEEKRFSIFESKYPEYFWSNEQTSPTITVSPTQTTTYRVTITDDQGQTCSTESTIMVNQTAFTSITGIEDFTDINQSPIILIGTPSGGKFSGKGIVDTVFNPKIAGLGKVTIEYNYSNDFGCSGLASESTIVFDTTGTVCISYDTMVTNIAISDTLVIKLPESNTKSFTYQNLLKVYPNPASNLLTIDLVDFEMVDDYRISIVNLSGQTIYSIPLNQQKTTIDLSTFNGNGIYFLQLIDHRNQIIENRKIVIQQ
jgi:hypothetical protein